MAQHPPLKYWLQYHSSPPAFPTTYLPVQPLSTFATLGIGKLRARGWSEEGRVGGWAWRQLHTRSPPETLQQGWHHSSEAQTPANHKKGVQPEHDKWWDSSALWKIRKSCYKDLNVQFQHYDSLFTSSLFPNPGFNSQTDSKCSSKQGGRQNPTNLYTENEDRAYLASIKTSKTIH